MDKPAKCSNCGAPLDAKGHESDVVLCNYCGTEMVLWKVWTPTSGVVYYLPDDAPEWREVAAPVKPAGNAQLSFGF